MAERTFSKEEKREWAAKKKHEEEEKRRLVEKQSPNDPNAEAAVLSAMLIDNYNVSYAMTWLKEDDFYRTSHRVVFRSMKDLYERNIEVDMVTLTNELKKERKKGENYEEIGGFEFLLNLSEMVMSGVHLKEHVRIIRDKSILRKLIQASDKIIQKCYKSDEEVSAILDQSEQIIFDIAENPLRESFGNFARDLDKTVEVIQDLISKKRASLGVQTGFIDLDKLIGGFREGQFIIIAARPAMGKSSFALNLAFNAAVSYDLNIALFTLEMETQEIIMRMLSSAAEVPMQSMLRGTGIDETGLERIVTVGEVLRDCHLFIDDDGHQTLNQIRARTRRLRAELGKLDMIIIDYLQLMSAEEKWNADNRQQQISDISRGLKILAKELGLPVIALSQLNRQVETREDKKPMLADLRESGAIEQDADIVMFIYREEVYSKKVEDKGKAELLIRKNRHGSIGTVNLTFLNEFTSFRNASKNTE